MRREEREVQLAVKTEEASRTLGSKLTGSDHAIPHGVSGPTAEAGLTARPIIITRP